MKSTSLVLTIPALALLLSSCGGGSDSSSEAEGVSSAPASLAELVDGRITYSADSLESEIELGSTSDGTIGRGDLGDIPISYTYTTAGSNGVLSMSPTRSNDSSATAAVDAINAALDSAGSALLVQYQDFLDNPSDATLETLRASLAVLNVTVVGSSEDGMSSGSEAIFLLDEISLVWTEGSGGESLTGTALEFDPAATATRVSEGSAVSILNNATNVLFFSASTEDTSTSGGTTTTTSGSTVTSVGIDQSIIVDPVGGSQSNSVAQQTLLADPTDLGRVIQN